MLYPHELHHLIELGLVRPDPMRNLDRKVEPRYYQLTADGRALLRQLHDVNATHRAGSATVLNISSTSEAA